VGIANVVIRTRQHLAALYPQGKLLILNILRYQNEIRPSDEVKVPEDLKDAKVQPRELTMAERLVEDMVMKWDPDEYHDTYRDDLLKLIEEKAHGNLKPVPKARAPREAQVIDFASLLEKSLAARRKGARAEPAEQEEAGEETPRRGAAKRKAPATKTRRKATTRTGTHHRRAA